MKNFKFLFQTISITFIVLFSLTSCEVDNEELSVEEEQVIDQEQPIDPNAEVVNIDNSSMRLTNQNVRRYYSGGSQSLHTYKIANSGTGIGSSEGIAFSTPVVNGAFDTSKYTGLFFLLHPQRKDFLMTTNVGEINNLISNRWRNLTYNRVIVQRRPGNGKVPLYRFYSSTNSDHLFTKNYSEGIRAGYRYEGITGYVN